MVGCEPIAWVFVWLFGWLVGWLVGWLAGWLFVWLVGWLVGWFVRSFVRSFVRAFVRSFLPALLCSIVCSFIRQFVRRDRWVACTCDTVSIIDDRPSKLQLTTVVVVGSFVVRLSFLCASLFSVVAFALSWLPRFVAPCLRVRVCCVAWLVGWVCVRCRVGVSVTVFAVIVCRSLRLARGVPAHYECALAAGLV